MPKYVTRTGWWRDVTAQKKRNSHFVVQNALKVLDVVLVLEYCCVEAQHKFTWLT